MYYDFYSLRGERVILFLSNVWVYIFFSTQVGIAMYIFFCKWVEVK